MSVGTLAQPRVSRQQMLLPFPQFLSATEANNPFGSSTYHSLQTKLVKRASHGITLLGSYTWSKAISNVNSQLAPLGNNTNGTGIQNTYDLLAERSISELDQKHSFVLNTVAEHPSGTARLSWPICLPSPITSSLAGSSAPSGPSRAAFRLPSTPGVSRAAPVA